MLRRPHTGPRLNWKLIAALVLVPYILYIPVLLITKGERLNGPQWLGWVGLGLGLVMLIVYAIVIAKWAPIGTTLMTAFIVGVGSSLLREAEQLLSALLAGRYHSLGMLDIPITLLILTFWATISGLIMMAVVGVVARFVESRAPADQSTESQNTMT